MRAVLRLQVLLRVPVGVEQDDGVGGREVDALAAGARAEQEDVAGRLIGTIAGFIGGGGGGLVEDFDLLLAVGLRYGTVDAADGPAAEGRVGGEEVELRFELAEYQDFVSSLQQVRQ